MKVTADMEAAYWYNRTWWENDGDIIEVRRAKAVTASLSHMTPGYDQFKRIMDGVICMFDSFAIPQGREVINYYMPLQYGFDKIIELCDEKIAECMGEAGTDGDFGMSRAYYYVAMKEITKGLSTWCENYSKQAKYLASILKIN